MSIYKLDIHKQLQQAKYDNISHKNLSLQIKVEPRNYKNNYII